MAPTVDPMIPAEGLSPYQPRAPPRKLATKAPAPPRPIVIQIPPGSLPGMISFASAPAIKPTSAVQIRFIGIPPGSGGLGLRSAAQQTADFLHHPIGSLLAEQPAGEPHQAGLCLGGGGMLVLQQRAEPLRIEHLRALHTAERTHDDGREGHQ